MKTSFTTSLAIAALGLTFTCTSLLADTDSTSHGAHASKSMKANPARNPDLNDRFSHSGFTTGVGSNPADHGINNSTATHPGDNGLNSGVGSSNDIKGSSTAAPTVNSADLNSKAGKGTKADTEKQGR